jgi:ribosomal protein L20
LVEKERRKKIMKLDAGYVSKPEHNYRDFEA